MYKKIGTGIEKKIGDTQYTIMAQPTWNYEKKAYDVRLFLGHEKLDLITELTDMKFVVQEERNKINATMEKFIDHLADAGKLDTAIGGYDYILEACLKSGGLVGEK